MKNYFATETQRHRGLGFLGLLRSPRTESSSVRGLSFLMRLVLSRIDFSHPPVCIRKPSRQAMFEMTVKMFIFVLFTTSIFSQATEPAKEEKKEKSNIEIMQENEAIIEKDRASREKEPLTGYDAETNSKKSIKENNAKYSNFWVVGGSIGSPASGNINVGYYFENFVLRLSGMRYSQHWNGIQGDIGYSFWKTSVVAHSVSLVFGTMNVRPFDPQTQQGGQNKYERDGIPGYTNQPQTFTDTLIRGYIAEQDPTLATLLEYQYRTRQYANFRQQYVGLTYDFLLGGFFLQLGMGFGSGTYRDPQLLLQMGYLLDFGRKAD